MGLDLYLYRVKKEQEVTEEEKKDESYLVILNEGENPEDNLEYKEINDVGLPLYKKDIGYYDFSDISLLDGYLDKFTNSGICYSGDHSYAIFREKENFLDGPEIRINLSDIGIRTMKQTVLYHEKNEIAYQRKQMSSDFYREWCHEGVSWIITKRSDMERIVAQSDIPEYTKENFLDNFVEGETFLFISY